MTAKEKAQELLDKMSSQTYSYQPYAGAHYNIEEIGDEAGKKCALIAVEEILDNGFHFIDESEFWKQVKQELLKL